jgi:hypothetical protein
MLYILLTQKFYCIESFSIRFILPVVNSGIFSVFINDMNYFIHHFKYTKKYDNSSKFLKQFRHIHLVNFFFVAFNGKNRGIDFFIQTACRTVQSQDVFQRGSDLNGVCRAEE